MALSQHKQGDLPALHTLSINANNNISSIDKDNSKLSDLHNGELVVKADGVADDGNKKQASNRSQTDIPLESKTAIKTGQLEYRHGPHPAPKGVALLRQAGCHPWNE